MAGAVRWHVVNSKLVELNKHREEQLMIDQTLPNEPQITDDMIPLWNVFWMVHRSRSAGFSAGPIPLNGITSYCDEFGIVDSEDRQRIIGFVYMMDNAYLKAVSDVQENERLNNKTQSKARR